MKTANLQTAVAEWMREREITAQFGLTHMILFNLRKAGEIRSMSLRAEGAKYGARLFHVGSVREYLARQEARDIQTEAAGGRAQ